MKYYSKRIGLNYMRVYYSVFMGSLGTFFSCNSINYHNNLTIADAKTHIEKYCNEKKISKNICPIICANITEKEDVLMTQISESSLYQTLDYAWNCNKFDTIQKWQDLIDFDEERRGELLTLTDGKEIYNIRIPNQDEVNYEDFAGEVSQLFSNSGSVYNHVKYCLETFMSGFSESYFKKNLESSINIAVDRLDRSKLMLERFIQNSEEKTKRSEEMIRMIEELIKNNEEEIQSLNKKEFRFDKKSVKEFFTFVFSSYLLDSVCIYPSPDLEDFYKNYEELLKPIVKDIFSLTEKYKIFDFQGNYVNLTSTLKVEDSVKNFFEENPNSNIVLLFCGSSVYYDDKRYLKPISEFLKEKLSDRIITIDYNGGNFPSVCSNVLDEKLWKAIFENKSSQKPLHVFEMPCGEISLLKDFPQSYEELMKIGIKEIIFPKKKE